MALNLVLSRHAENGTAIPLKTYMAPHNKELFINLSSIIISRLASEHTRDGDAKQGWSHIQFKKGSMQRRKSLVNETPMVP